MDTTGGQEVRFEIGMGWVTITRRWRCLIDIAKADTMTADTYHKMIMAGIDGLPADILAEIADYVLYLRRKVVAPDTYAVEQREALLRYALHSGWHDSLAHLEEEFADYDQQFPRN